MKKPLLIYGGGGLGREVLSLIACDEQWEPVGFIDDGLTKGLEIKGVKVLGGIEALNGLRETFSLVLAIGDPGIKATIRSRISNPSINFPVLRHPSVLLQDAGSIPIGEGSILTAGVIVTTDVVIGNYVLINLNSTVGHNSHIGNYASLMPGVNVAGYVRIGERVFIGAGANIINNVVLGDGCKVGMGAAVIQDVPSGVTVVGVPAKSL